jgi:hypothetical protein
MIVVCIKEFPNDKVILTIGKQYVDHRSPIIGYYLIDDDNSERGLIGKEFFIELEKYREEKINKIIK